MKVKINPNIDKSLLIYILETAINTEDIDPELETAIFIQQEKEIFFPVIIENNDIFYHGTSEFLAKRIENIGKICIPEVTGIGTMYGDPSTDRIYLTTNKRIAFEYAKSTAIADKSSPAIFKITGKDINAVKCKAFVDVLMFNILIQSIVLKGCKCIKAVRDKIEDAQLERIMKTRE